MMHWIVSSCLRLRVLVVALSGLMLIVGISQLSNKPLDVVPEFSPIYLEVQTEALGLSADEVESLITVPLEADLLNGLPWMKSIESESITGLSSIKLYFEPGTKLMSARQMVQERLTQAHALPNVSKPPVLLQPVSSASRIMNIGLSSKTVSLIEMSVQSRWNIVPRLVGVQGVANVSIWGLRDRQLQVQVDPKFMHSKGVSLNQIIKTAGEAVWASPLTYLNSSTPGAGGFIDTPNQRLGVRHISPITTPETFAKIPVYGTSLALGDVSHVIENHQPLIGDAVVKGETGLILVVEKFPWANTVAVTRDVEKALAELAPGLTGIDIDTSIYRPSSFIERAEHNLLIAFLIGTVLMALGFGLISGKWRIALISMVSISLAIVVASNIMLFYGVSINMMMLGGLMLAITTIIDDAIVSTDNVLHRSKSLADSQNTLWAIIHNAVLEIRRPMLYATVLIVLSVAPVLFMEGYSAALFKPLIWSFATAVVISMLVALTVTPVLCVLFLSKESALKPTSSAFIRALQALYDKMATTTLRPPPAIVFAIVAVTLVVVLFPQIKFSLLPSFKETDIVVELDSPPSTSRPAMNGIVKSAISELQKIPGVRNAAAHIGRAILSDEVDDVNAAQIWVSIDPNSDYDATMSAIKDSMEKQIQSSPGTQAQVQTYLTKRMHEVLTGADDNISVRVYGHDLGIVQSKAEEVKAVMAKTPGVVNPKVEKEPEHTTVEVEVNLESARNYGLKPGDVRRAASSLLGGITVGALFQQQKVFDVVVWGSPDVRKSADDLKNLLIDTPSGDQVRLGEVAFIRETTSPSVIRRQGVSRYIDVNAQVSDRAMSAVAQDLAVRIKKIPFPFEYHAQVLGEHLEKQTALNSLYSYAVVAAIIMFLVLHSALGSWRLAVLSLFVGAPTAALGGILVVYFSGGVFSLGAFVGLMAVLALSARNGIMLVRHFQYLEKQEGKNFGKELVIRGIDERFSSIIASVVITVLFMLPFLILGNVAGLEVINPMAAVIMGGLLSSTALVLFVIPALYIWSGEGSASDTLQFELKPSSS